MFVTRLGTEYDYVKILDFGVVKDQSGRDATVLSNQDIVHGTPAFMPPEIVMGETHRRPRGSLFAGVSRTGAYHPHGVRGEHPGADAAATRPGTACPSFQAIGALSPNGSKPF